MKILMLLLCAFAIGGFSCNMAAAENSSDDTAIIKDPEETKALLAFMKKRHDSMKKEFTEKRLKKMGIFEDPRYAKKVYGGLQGVQKSAKEQHKRLADTKSFKTEEEKEAFAEDLNKDTTLTFQDFNATQEQIAADITAKPLEKTQEMVANMKLMNEDYTSMTSEKQDDLRKRVEALFEQENGMSFDTYMDLLEEQAKADADLPVQPEKLGANVRFANQSNIKIEKVNETTAIIKKTAAKG